MVHNDLFRNAAIGNDGIEYRWHNQTTGQIFHSLRGTDRPAAAIAPELVGRVRERFPPQSGELIEVHRGCVLSRLLWLGLVLQILPALVSAGTAGYLEQERLPSSDSVSQLIAREGPRRALEHLTRDDAAWFEVLRQVSSGSPAWIRIAAQLKPVADGGPGEELVISMQDALPTRTALILGIVEKGGSFTAAEVCGNYGSGQIEDERPKSTILVLIRKRQDAVQAVSDPALAVAKNACLSELKGLERTVRAKAPSPPRSHE